MTIEIYVGIVQFIVLLLSLSIHESAHAWTADRFGDPTARYLGRVSLNPIVHADLMGTIVFPLIGIFVLRGAMFGWAKPVPVNVTRLKHPSRDHMVVAAAGPLSNLLLAAVPRERTGANAKLRFYAASGPPLSRGSGNAFLSRERLRPFVSNLSNEKATSLKRYEADRQAASWPLGRSAR